MPWWKGSNSVSPSPSHSPFSSSSSPNHSVESPSPTPRANRSRDAGALWGRREAQRRRLTRQRKFRHTEDILVEAGVLGGGGGVAPLSSSSTPVSRTVSVRDAAPARSSSSPVLLPRPLPLPEFVGSGLGHAAPCSGGCPLPSPREALCRGDGDLANGFLDVEPIGERFSLASVLGSRLAYHTPHRSPERVKAPSAQFKSSEYREALQDLNSVEDVNFRLNVPVKSAPASGLLSPVHSPRRSNVDCFASTYDPSQGFLVWSAQEFTSTDMMTGVSPLPSPEKILASPDHSPRYNPTLRSPALRSRNPSAPPSPLHPKMFLENTSGWHDSNGNIDVHPLPLPPVPAAPLQAAKADVPAVINQWQKGKLIGSGTFGSVYLATNRNNGALCAMKEVNIIPDDPKSAECLKQLEQEIKLLSQLKHPNIVQYYGSEMIEDRFYIYLEYVYPGSIQKFVREHFGAMTESIVRNFTRHILQGLAYLHNKRTMHRDIKGANLLVDAHGVVKLADFGMAKHLSGAADALSLKGTPYWMAPEMVQATMNKDIGYDFAVDIWSLGCTIIEMFTGKHPWSGLEGAAAMFKVLHKDPHIPENLSPEGKDFLQKCFRRNPADRPSASTLLEHPFIRNSHHYNLHGSIQAFAGIKLSDNVYSPRDKPKSKSDPTIKRKQLPNGETSHSHPGTSESAAIRLSLHSTLEAFPSVTSLPHLNQVASGHNSSSSLNGLINIHLANGSHHPHVLPKPHG